MKTFTFAPTSTEFLRNQIVLPAHTWYEAFMNEEPYVTVTWDDETICEFREDLEAYIGDCIERLHQTALKGWFDSKGVYETMYLSYLERASTVLEFITD